MKTQIYNVEDLLALVEHLGLFRFLKIMIYFNHFRQSKNKV